MPPRRNCRPRFGDSRRMRRRSFFSAFNGAWQSYGDHPPQEQEEIAFRVAWAAVKKLYRKQGEVWIPKAR